MADLFQDALKEAYSFAPADEVILETIELRHASFLDEGLQNVPIRVVRDVSNFVGLLESDAPVDAGSIVTFIGMGFDITLPSIEPGIAPELIVAVDDVASPFATGQRLSYHVDQAAKAGGEIKLTYRVWLASNPVGGPMMKPMHLELDVFDASGGRITGRASFEPDLESRIFPFGNYTAKQFPLLGALNKVVL